MILRQKKNFKHKNNEFNSAAIFSVWHELPMLRRGKINVAGIRSLDGRKLENSSEKIALLLHRHVDVPCSLVVT